MVINECSFRRQRGVLADDEGDAAMRIHVIGAVLSVIFDDENGGVIPVRTVRNSLDDAAHGKVVVGNAGGGLALPGAGCGGVVVGQAQQHEIRQLGALVLLARANKLFKLVQKLVGAQLVGI